MSAKTEKLAAAEDGAESGGKAPARGSVVQAAAALGVLTLVAAGSGTFLGLHLVGTVETAIKAKAAQQRPPAPEPRYAQGTSLLKIPAVVTNLASPQDVWVRLEASIIVADQEIESPDVLSGQIAEDILGFLRTLPLERIEGPSGLLHLREDLNDRVAIRSNDRVRELIIETLVIQ